MISCAYFNRGLVYVKMKEDAAAVEEFRSAVASDPRFSDAHTNLGLALLRTGQLEGAHKAFSEAAAVLESQRSTTVQAKHASVLVNLGNVALARNHYTEAVDKYTQALELQPRNSGALNNRGVALHHQAKLGLALCDYNSALKVGRQMHNTYINRAQLHVARQDVYHALEDLACLDRCAAAPEFVKELLDFCHRWQWGLCVASADFLGAVKSLPEYSAHRSVVAGAVEDPSFFRPRSPLSVCSGLARAAYDQEGDKLSTTRKFACCSVQGFAYDAVQSTRQGNNRAIAWCLHGTVSFGGPHSCGDLESETRGGQR